MHFFFLFLNEEMLCAAVQQPKYSKMNAVLVWIFKNPKRKALTEPGPDVINSGHFDFISLLQKMKIIQITMYLLPQNKIFIPTLWNLTVVRVFTKSTVWPSPAGISSSSSAQPAAALPLDYWCSVLSVQSLLSEGLGEDIGYVFVMRILIEIYKILQVLHFQTFYINSLLQSIQLNV